MPLAAQGIETRPNILLIIVDDLAPVGSGFDGPVHTPALDQLAERGFRFDNNFANVPVCGASRASFLSGLAPSAERFLTHNTRLDKDAPQAITLPAFFQQNGWHTLAYGKVFDVTEDSAQGWSEPVWNPDDQWYSPKEPDGREAHLQKSYMQPVSGPRGPAFEKAEAEDSAYPDGQIAMKSVAGLERMANGKTPFFMAIGFRKPHLPFNAPAKYWTDKPSDIALPPSWHSTASGIPSQATHRSAELRTQYDAIPLLSDPTPDTAQQLISAYYAATRFIDQQIGRVLQALDDTGLAENTIVAILGDHGFLLAEQRMWTKHALFEPALRTPLIIAAPGFDGGKDVVAISDLLDIYPTLADLTGLPHPAHLEGQSLVPLLEDPSLAFRPDKPASISRWMNGESVRNTRYRYTRWNDEQNNTTAELLFDLEADPDELTNIVGDVEAASALASLQDQLANYGQDAHWSKALGKVHRFWNLANSSLGGYAMAALLYPVQTVAGLLVFIVLLGATIRYRLRRRR